jgi:tetratricopeptide (TPR) repeat protein
MFKRYLVKRFLVIMAVLATTWLFLPDVRWGYADQPASDPVVERINKQVSKLVGSAPHGESQRQKAARTVSAIKAGDFSTAHKIFADVYAQSKMENWHLAPFHLYIPGLTNVDDPVFGERLDDWVSKAGKDSIPYLVRAQYLNDMAWQKRGGSTIDKIETGQIDSFEKYRDGALADVDTAIRLDGKNPYAQYLKLNILHGDGNSARMGKAFTEAVAKFPNYYALYPIRLDTLVPKWGGSVDEMYALVDKYAGKAPKESPMKMLYLELYNALVDSASFDCRKLEGQSWNGCYISVMTGLQRPSLDQGITDAIDLYDRLDKYQVNQFMLEKLTTIVNISRIDNHALEILQKAAEKTGTDMQMMETNPGHNNHVFDILTAWSWMNAGGTENAEKKLKEALQDMEHGPFPSQIERDLNVADVYFNLAAIYETRSEFETAIAYRMAADIMAGSTQNAQVVCHAYYKLKLYTIAIDMCGKIVDRSNDPEARVWRGMSYRELGDLERAEKDLRIVAASDRAQHRYYAASFVDWILATRKDWKGMLQFFEEHPARFNEKTQSDYNLSFAFNNRCAAYMYLGELQKALDDCNVSLKHGNLPDAVEKRAEIVKRLKGKERGI